MPDSQAAKVSGQPMRPPPPVPPRPITPTPTSPSRSSQGNAFVDVPLASSRGSLPGAVERRNTPPAGSVESSSAKQRLMYYSRVGVIPPPAAPAPVSYAPGGASVRSATDFAASDRQRTPRTSISIGDSPDLALALFVPPCSSIVDYIFTKVHVYSSLLYQHMHTLQCTLYIDILCICLHFVQDGYLLFNYGFHCC